MSDMKKQIVTLLTFFLVCTVVSALTVIPGI